MHAQCVACIRCVIWADIYHATCHRKMYSEQGRYVINIFIS